MTMLNACAEAHAFAPLRFAHAVEMWYFGGVVMNHTEKVLGKDYLQYNSETYSINSSSVETTRVECENS